MNSLRGLFRRPRRAAPDVAQNARVAVGVHPAESGRRGDGTPDSARSPANGHAAEDGGAPAAAGRTEAPRAAAFAAEARSGSPFVVKRDPSEPSSAAMRASTAAAPAAVEPDEAAAFSLAAPGLSWRRRRPDAGEDPSNAVLREAFTPTRPKQDAALFSGRYRQMRRVIAAIEEERAHVMIYGERGSGKTSLANVLAGKAEQAGYLVLRQSCSSEITFEDLFRGFLRRMPAGLATEGLGALGRTDPSCDLEHLVPARFGVTELVTAFEQIRERHIVLIVDEFDRVTDEDVKVHLAELLKNMSDRGVPVTLLIIGVAENVGQLLGKHPSLHRAVVTVPMPLMSRQEIEGIITAGEQRSGIRFDPTTRQAVVDFSQGLPYHAQLLCLFAARNAICRGSAEVGRDDLRVAVRRSAEEAEARIREAYDQAVGSGETASFHDVIFHAARCRTDDFGTFAAADVAAAAVAGGNAEASVLAVHAPLKNLTAPDHGAVLRHLSGPAGPRYQFVTQIMRYHVLARQAEERGLI